MKWPGSAEFRCVGAVKVSRPTRGACREPGIGQGAAWAVPLRGDHPRDGAVIWKEHGGDVAALPSATVWAEAGKKSPLI